MRISLQHRNHRPRTWLYVLTFIIVAAVSYKVGRQVEMQEMVNLPMDYN